MTTSHKTVVKHSFNGRDYESTYIINHSLGYDSRLYSQVEVSHKDKGMGSIVATCYGTCFHKPEDSVKELKRMAKNLEWGNT